VQQGVVPLKHAGIPAAEQCWFRNLPTMRLLNHICGAASVLLDMVRRTSFTSG
jgi:hypothetical protein